MGADSHNDRASPHGQALRHGGSGWQTKGLRHYPEEAASSVGGEEPGERLKPSHRPAWGIAVFQHT